MNTKEMRQLPSEELRSEIEKTREKIFRMRFQGKGKDLENPGQLRMLKRQVAQMYTVLSERRRALAGSAPAGDAGAAAKGASTLSGTQTKSEG